MSEAVLIVDDLKTHFFTRDGVVRAVDGVDLRVEAGQVLGLVGESGSGKSMTGYSILGLVDAPGRIVAGRILLYGRDKRGRDLRALAPEAMRDVRGNRIAMIFQDPMMSLNPVLTIETQMIEAMTAHPAAHGGASKTALRERASATLARVGIASPHERLAAYPHQFSGGMRQRVAIAIALLNEPDVIVCDEPTTALDVTIQGQILYEMQKLCRESGTALLWITHDLTVVAGLADRVSVMYAGRIVESGTTAEVLETPRHPYTQGLIASSPAAALRSGSDAPQRRLAQIPGMPPSLAALPQGCAFRPRCSRATNVCLVEPPLTYESTGRNYRCFHPIVSGCGFSLESP